MFVDELPVALLQPLLAPQGLAMKPNGNIVVALGLSCVELDPSFKLVDEPAGPLETRESRTMPSESPPPPADRYY